VVGTLALVRAIIREAGRQGRGDLLDDAQQRGMT